MSSAMIPAVIVCCLIPYVDISLLTTFSTLVWRRKISSGPALDH